MNNGNQNNGLDDDRAYYLDHLKKARYGQYLATLYTSETQRDTALALFAFNYELSQIAINVSEVSLRQIRLQWWLDALGEAALGQSRDHPVLRLIEHCLKTQPDLLEQLKILVSARQIREAKEKLSATDLIDESEAIGTALVTGLAMARGVTCSISQPTGALIMLSDIIAGLEYERDSNKSMTRVAAEINTRIKELRDAEQAALKSLMSDQQRENSVVRQCYLILSEGAKMARVGTKVHFSALQWHLKALKTSIGFQL